MALQVLFLRDASPELSADAALALYFDHFHAVPLDEDGDGRNEEINKREAAAHEMAETIVRGVDGALEKLDDILRRVSKNWRIERMAPVDRNVMRLALWEMTSCPDIPLAVTLNEAIELGKRFGSGEAGAFVNGVLDQAITELGIRK